jgi:hypothetical protein
MNSAIATPANTPVANMSTTNRNHGASPIRGRCASRSTIATAASAIVGSSTTKPQKIKACIRPGTNFWKSFRWASTWISSRRTRAAGSAERFDGRAARITPIRALARLAKTTPATAIAATSVTALRSPSVAGSPP